MKEYNWHEERKKYQGRTSSSEMNTPVQNVQPAYAPAKSTFSPVKLILVILLALVVVGTGVFFGVSKLLTLKNNAVTVVTAPAPNPPAPAPTPAPAPNPPAPAPTNSVSAPIYIKANKVTPELVAEAEKIWGNLPFFLRLLELL